MASSVLTTNNDEDRRNTDSENYPNHPVNFANNRNLETVLVFALEDDNEIGMLGLLTEEEVRFNS